ENLTSVRPKVGRERRQFTRPCRTRSGSGAFASSITTADSGFVKTLCSPCKSARRCLPRGSLYEQGVVMTRSFAHLFLILIAWSASALSWGDGSSQQEMRSLDEQVQEIKTDALGIATDLSQLEERLLFPSTTQVSVFISLSPQEPFRLDAVQIRID